MNRLLEEQSLYTNAQEILLIITPYFTAPLSVVGSGLILYVIIKERKRTLKETYHRQMLGMSILNFLNSLSIIVLGHWAVNADLVDYPGARGNATTCSISGFFLNLVFGSMWYMFFLSLCFTLRVTCQCRTKCIARYAETIGHFLSFVVPVLAGLAAALNEGVNPLQDLPGWCWSTDFPKGCRDTNDEESTTCLRGDDYEALGDRGTIIFLWAGIIICMILIVVKVWRTERRIRNYAGGRSSSLVQTKQAGVRALWYIGVFFIVYLPIAVLLGLGKELDADKRGLYFTFAFLTKICLPLQGFLTSLVFFRWSFRSLLQDGRALSFLSGFVDKVAIRRSTESTATSRTTTATSAANHMSAVSQNVEHLDDHNHVEQESSVGFVVENSDEGGDLTLYEPPPDESSPDLEDQGTNEPPSTDEH